MAGRHRGADHGGRRSRAADACAHRNAAGVKPARRARVQSRSQGSALGPAQASEGPITAFIYVNTSKHVGECRPSQIFATVDAAEKWFGENDPEGLAFEYEILE